jgi:GNAT superfamily N-acetyltransferase
MAKLEYIGNESLDTIVELDSATNGSHRRDFFIKRFEAQDKHPEAFISIGAVEAGKMVGFVFCHLLQGEFGGDELIAVLDAMAVEPGSQGHGVGHELMQQLIDGVRRRGGKDLRTQVGWDQPGVIDFFSNTGFSMAPRLILERSTHDVRF